MPKSHLKSFLHLASVLLALGLIVTACRPSATPTPQPTPTPQATATPKATATPAPTPTLGPLELTVLHTNDLLGYTEPCG